MESLAIELTAQIAEQSGGVSESICLVREAVNTGILTQESLAKLNCRRGLTSQMDSDRELVLSNLPIINLISSQISNLEGTLINPEAPDFHKNGISFIDPNDPDEFPFFKILHTSLGRLGMARYRHDLEQYNLWRSVHLGQIDLLEEYQIIIEYELKLDYKKKAYFDIRHMFLQKMVNPSEKKETENYNTRSNIG